MPNILPVHNRIIDSANGLRRTELGRLAYALLSSGCGYTANYVSLARRDYDLSGLGPSLREFGPVPIVGLNLSESFDSPDDVAVPKVEGSCVRVPWLAAVNGIGSVRHLAFEGMGQDGPVLIGTTAGAIIRATSLALDSGLHEHCLELELLATIQGVA